MPAAKQGLAGEAGFFHHAGGGRIGGIAIGPYAVDVGLGGRPFDDGGEGLGLVEHEVAAAGQLDAPLQVGGRTLPAGDYLTLGIGAANHDPAVFHQPGVLALGLVVGATFPEEIARVRELAPTLPLLIPGVGAQGGDAAATVKAGLRTDAQGAITGTIIVNSSRAVLYASGGDDFASAARRAAMQTRDALNAAR